MKPIIRRVLISLAALAAVFFVAWIIRRADEGEIPAFIAALYNYPNGDKLGHFLLMGALAFLTTLALPKRFRLTGLAVLGILLALEEYSQQFFAHRHSSWLDLASSLAGVAVFGTLALWLTHSFGKSGSPTIKAHKEKNP